MRASFIVSRPLRSALSFGAAAALAVAALALLSCAPAPPVATAQRMLRGDFAGALESAQRWEEREPKGPAPAFAARICRYFQGDVEAVLASGGAPLTKEDADKVAAWVRDATAGAPNSAIASFLKAVSAELGGDAQSARALYLEAEKAEPSNLLLRYSRIAAEQGDDWAAEIPADSPLTYEGEMKLVANVWVPIEGQFRVTGGTLRTRVGDIERSATFGAWKPLVSSENGKAVAWAALLTQGEVVVRADRSAPTDAKRRVTLRVEGTFTRKVFDVLGKYYLATLDESKQVSFPLIPVPFYMPDGETWDGRLVLSPSLSVDPTNFQRLRSFGANRNAVRMQEKAKLYHGPDNPRTLGGMVVMQGHRQQMFGDLRIMVESGRLWGPVTSPSQL